MIYRLKTGSIVALLVFALAANGCAQKPNSPEQQVDSYVKNEVATKHLAAVSVAVVRDGKVVLARGYGLANLETKTPATAETVYEIGSITKQFTATAIMMLVEQGKIGLDDPVSKHYKEAPAAWSKVTIRNLLNHTSGIKGYTEVGNIVKMFRDDHTEEEIIKLVSALPLVSEPGEKWAYCNTGYYLLGMIVESVSGQKLPEFLDEHVFKHGALLEKQLVLLGRAEAHDLLHPAAGVPGAVKQHHLAARRQLRHVALHQNWN